MKIRRKLAAIVLFLLAILPVICILPLYSTSAKIDFKNGSFYVIQYSDTTYLSDYGDNVGYVNSVDTYSNYYGWSFSFSTNPYALITVYGMTETNFWKWIDDEYATTYTVMSSRSSGSGTWRFPSTNVWYLVFYMMNAPSGYTYLSVTWEVVNLGAPPAPHTNPSNPSGSFSIWAIIIPVVVVLAIIAIIIGVVVRNKRKKPTIYPSPGATYQPPIYPRPIGTGGYSRPVIGNSIPPQLPPQVAIQMIYDRGNQLFMQGNILGAVNIWEELLRSIPNFHPAMNNLGVAYMRLENPEKAIEYFNRAIALDPTNQVARNNLAMALSTIQPSFSPPPPQENYSFEEESNVNFDDEYTNYSEEENKEKTKKEEDDEEFY
ncbi:MAG: tetratricopeptide repeat protein [Candidatus Thorarchaeota archaeon]